MIQNILLTLIVSFLFILNCSPRNEKSAEDNSRKDIGFEIGETVYVNSPSGLILREAPSKSSPKMNFLHYGLPVIISKINDQQDLVDGKYQGYWLQKEKDGWFFSYFVSKKPNESNIKAVFNRLLSEFEEFKELDETNIELSGNSYSYYYETQSHIHPELKSINFNGNTSVTYALETWHGEESYEDSIKHNASRMQICTLDMALIKRRLKFILKIKSDEALSGKPSFKRKSIYGFWAKVCK